MFGGGGMGGGRGLIRSSIIKDLDNQNLVSGSKVFKMLLSK